MTTIPKHTYRVTIGADTYTRTTWSEYTHAVRKDGRVTWHKSQDAARRRAGSSGTVVAIPEAQRTCIVCDGTREYTERTSDGTMRTTPCWKCSR